MTYEDLIARYYEYEAWLGTADSGVSAYGMVVKDSSVYGGIRVQPSFPGFIMWLDNVYASND